MYTWILLYDYIIWRHIKSKVQCVMCFDCVMLAIFRVYMGCDKCDDGLVGECVQCSTVDIQTTNLNHHKGAILKRPNIRWDYV